MKLSGIYQLWVADITYIRLKAEFAYLAVILDGYSRGLLGLALGRTLASRLAVAALEGGDREMAAALWLGASLGLRRAIRLRRIRGHPQAAGDDSDHEPPGKPI
jgi:transposase InsO family protein